MAWDGYYKLGTTEIINKSRTFAYARAKGLSFVKDDSDNPYLGPLLGQTYTTPEADNPPWADPDKPQSYGFCGVLPIEVSGVEDSTRTSEIFEFTTDGGNPGRIRNTTKPVVFNVALVGASEAAVEYGFGWLKRALLARDCTPANQRVCRGQDLAFSSVAPHSTEIVVAGSADEFDEVLDGGNPETYITEEVDGGVPGDPDPVAYSDEWADFERHLRDVVVNRGPTITKKKSGLACGGSVWVVTFTATAGDPFQYGPSLPVLRDWGDGTAPYATGVTGTYGSTTYVEATCPAPVYTPIFDPDCAALTPPPPPPDIAPGCFDINVGDGWSREYAEIPASMIPLWDEVRPVVTLRTDADDARMVRVRFYEGTADPDVECGAVGEFVVSYIPAFHTLVVDTVAQAVYAYSNDGVVRRADSLVYGDGNARPIQWFGLSCGDSYTVTMDRETAALDAIEIDLDLAPRSA